MQKRHTRLLIFLTILYCTTRFICRAGVLPSAPAITCHPCCKQWQISTYSPPPLYYTTVCLQKNALQQGSFSPVEPG